MQSIVNKYADEMLNCIDAIQKHYDFRELKDLLMHNDLGVRSWIANMLLPIYEDISLEILNNIYKQNIPFISMSARAMFCKWKNEPISFD